jgi:hypothetical protein
MTSEDCDKVSLCVFAVNRCALYTFPTAASPSRTSLTLLLGFGCAEASAIVMLEMLLPYKWLCELATVYG